MTASSSGLSTVDPGRLGFHAGVGGVGPLTPLLHGGMADAMAVGQHP